MQPVTRARYEQARCESYKWLTPENLFLPHSARELDLVVSDYLEFLWAQCKGRTEGPNILAGLHRFTRCPATLERQFETELASHESVGDP